jgi:hypothetical protein
MLFLIVSCTKESTSNNSSSTGTGGSLARFTIVGNYLYLANINQLEVFDITDSGNPEEKNVIGLEGNAETIFAYNNNLLIGSTTGMFIYSLADPENPKKLGAASHVRSCDPVVANDSIAFVTLRGGTACGPATDGLYIHNIKDLLNPIFIKLMELPTPAGLGLNDSILYVCQMANGLSVIDVKNPVSPLKLKNIDGAFFYDVIVYDKLLICYVETGIRLYDISTADDPMFINLIQY